MSLPKGPISSRIHALYGRRPGTHWNAKEVKALQVLVKQGVFATPAAMADLEMVERFYVVERKKGIGPNGGVHRRNLLTFLNFYQGEVDKARAWEEKGAPRKRPPKHFEQRTDATGANIVVEVDPVAVSEPVPISELTLKFLADFERVKGRKLKGSFVQ